MTSRTEDAYIHWIRRFVVFNGKSHPDDLGNREISLFLALLATDGQVCGPDAEPGAQRVAVPYTKVLQRDVGAVDRPVAKVPVGVPVVLTVNEVRLVLRQLSGGAVAGCAPFVRRRCAAAGMS